MEALICDLQLQTSSSMHERLLLKCSYSWTWQTLSLNFPDICPPHRCCRPPAHSPPAVHHRPHCTTFLHSAHSCPRFIIASCQHSHSCLSTIASCLPPPSLLRRPCPSPVTSSLFDCCGMPLCGAVIGCRQGHWHIVHCHTAWKVVVESTRQRCALQFLLYPTLHFSLPKHLKWQAKKNSWIRAFVHRSCALRE